MRDPFRQNSSSQLIREAQIAFVVIAALLCVLVYVAFHRVSGRKFRFQQISKVAPVAENIADVPYPAEVLIDKEDKVIQDAFDTISALADPEADVSSAPSSSPTSGLSSVETPATPKVTTFEALPVAEISVAGASPVVPMPSVAQTNFVEPAAEKKPVDDPFEGIKPLKPFKPFVPLPKPEKLAPSKAIPVDQDIPSKDEKGSGDNFSAESKSMFIPPKIESNFGANAERKLSSTEPPKKMSDSETEALVKNKSFNPGQFEPSLKTTIAQPKFSNTDPASTSLKQEPPHRPKADTSKRSSPELNVYEVQPNDSLWSIATEKYGDGRFFRALHHHNRERIASVDQLRPHTTIDIPELAELKKLYPSLCPSDQLRSDVDPQDSLAAEYEIREQQMKDRYYVTKSGDTLFGVARQRLGQASRYLEIYELNQFRIPEQVNHLTPLKPGLRLLLPE